MKNQILLSFGMLLSILTMSSTTGFSQNVAYGMNKTEPAFVMIQLQESPQGQLPLNEPKALDVVQKIKAINTKLGYGELEKMMASFSINEDGVNITYLTIRRFTDLSSADAYAKAIEKELPKDIYGKIKKPFPVTQSDYNKCVEEKGFSECFKYYSKSSQ